MKPKFLTRSALMALIASVSFTACAPDEVMPEYNDPISDATLETVLGKKLENPFSVEVMKRAMDSLIQEDTELKSRPPLRVRTTHLYVRLLPPDNAAYDRLLHDSTLQFSDYPLDREIIQYGDHYHDPSIPDTLPTWQYTTVPVTYLPPPAMKYEVLDELYLPQQDDAFLVEGRSDARTQDWADKLEDEALQITGDLSSAADNAEARSSSRWTPQGTIRVFDNRLRKYLPLEGVKVRARRWFDTKTAYTDKNGHFRMNGSFRYEANYSIVWERNDFDIRSGTFGQARFNGPKQKGDWNLNIERNGMSFHYAHVFRAAMRYYYGDIGGLKRPGFRLKYAVFNKRGNHSGKNLGNWSAFGINPNIQLYRYSSLDGTENDADEMFSTTCHETAHTTHMETMNAGLIQFGQVSATIRESWAIAVEWFITQKVYQELGIKGYATAGYGVQANYPIMYGFQFWNKRRNAQLTSLFIDLVDTNNQLGQKFGYVAVGTVHDPVAGYTLHDIESGFLKNVYGIASLGEELKRHKPGEVSNKQIDQLLADF